jgi:hypothetical protein
VKPDSSASDHIQKSKAVKILPLFIAGKENGDAQYPIHVEVILHQNKKGLCSPVCYGLCRY